MNKFMFWKNEMFWDWSFKATMRALRTGLQVFLSAFGTSQVVSQIDFKIAASMVITSMLLSYVMSAVSKLPELEEKEGKE